MTGEGMDGVMDGLAKKEAQLETAGTMPERKQKRPVSKETGMADAAGRETAPEAACMPHGSPCRPAELSDREIEDVGGGLAGENASSWMYHCPKCGQIACILGFTETYIKLFCSGYGERFYVDPTSSNG